MFVIDHTYLIEHFFGKKIWTEKMSFSLCLLLLLGALVAVGQGNGCTTKIAVAIDVSASMSLDGAFSESQFKDVLKIAMRLYLFKDHGACVSVYAYATTWRMILGYTAVNSATSRATLLRAVDELQFETAYPAYYTNWEAGLRAPVLSSQQNQVPGLPNMLFFITNGSPTTRTTACTGPQPCDDLSQNMINAQYASQLVQSFNIKVVPMGLGTNVTDELLAKVAGRCDVIKGCVKNHDYYHVENLRRDFADAVAKSLKMDVASKKEQEEATNEVTSSQQPEEQTVSTSQSSSSSSSAAAITEPETTTTTSSSASTTTSTTTKEPETTTTTKEPETTTTTKEPETTTTTTSTSTSTTTSTQHPTTTTTTRVHTTTSEPPPPPHTTKHRLTHQNRPPVNTIHRPDATATPYPQTDQQRTSFKHKQPVPPPPPTPVMKAIRHEHLFTHNATIIFIILVSSVAFLIVVALLCLWCCMGERGCCGRKYVEAKERPIQFVDVRVEAGLPATPEHAMRHSKEHRSSKFSLDGPNYNKMH